MSQYWYTCNSFNKCVIICRLLSVGWLSGWLVCWFVGWFVGWYDTCDSIVIALNAGVNTLVTQFHSGVRRELQRYAKTSLENTTGSSHESNEVLVLQ